MSCGAYNTWGGVSLGRRLGGKATPIDTEDRCHVRFVPIAAVPNVHSRKAPATWANPQVLLLKKWTVTGFYFCEPVNGTKRTTSTPHRLRTQHDRARARPTGSSRPR